ncbi:MAG: phage tail protein [Peptostreptococcaceae bacterium]|nr:phage tail protein [Peptostreptococcaceae bacterium]
MIEIYLKTNTNYDKNGDITLEPTSCIYKDNEKEVTLEHFFDDEGRWKYIEFENVIAAEENGKKKLYRIYNVIRSLYNVTAYARPIFYDLADKVLIDVRPTLKNGEEALNILLEGTGYTGHSNISKLNTSYYVRKNIVEALIGDIDNSFINRWGGEFYCENFDVYINDRIGSDNGVRVEFGYNLNEIEEDINIENVVTRIIPVGFNGITLEGDTPWVDSSLINKYTRPKMRVIEFSDVKVKESPDDEEGFNTIEEAREELIRQCNLLFESGVDKPTVNYKIDMINLANTTAYKELKMLVEVNKGDTVTCYIKHLDIDVKARVIDYERDLITGEYTYIELGSVLENFFNKQADIEATVNKIINPDGTVNAIEVAGVLNAINVKMRAMKDIAQKQDVRALICEDLDPESPTYGAMCYGTMGFMIASERTPDNRDWDWRTFGTGKGFFADLIVAGTMLADRIRGGVLESIDGSIQLDLSNTSTGIQFKRNGKKAIDILGSIMKFYDWDGEGEAIAQIFSSRLDGDENRTGLAVANKSNSYLTLGYERDGKFYPYIRLDKDNIDQITNSPMTIFEEIDFRGSQIWFGYELNSIYKATSNNLVANVKNGLVVLDRDTAKHIAFFRNGRCYFASNDKVYFDATPEKFTFFKDGKAYFFKDVTTDAIWSMYDFKCDRRVHVNGDLTVVGNKNCVQKTENYGDRLFYCIEDCESYLTDRSMELFTVEKTLEGTYERVILLDSIFKEAVRTDQDYTIEIFKQGWGDYRIKEQNKDYFIVESDREDFTFKYVVTAKKRYFEDERLGEFFKPENYTDLEDISNKSIEELGEVVCEYEDN